MFREGEWVMLVGRVGMMLVGRVAMMLVVRGGEDWGGVNASFSL